MKKEPNKKRLFLEKKKNKSLVKMEMKKCLKCFSYTLEDLCKKCKEKTVSPKYEFDFKFLRN